MADVRREKNMFSPTSQIYKKFELEKIQWRVSLWLRKSPWGEDVNRPMGPLEAIRDCATPSA